MLLKRYRPHKGQYWSTVLEQRAWGYSFLKWTDRIPTPSLLCLSLHPFFTPPPAPSCLLPILFPSLLILSLFLGPSPTYMFSGGFGPQLGVVGSCLLLACSLAHTRVARMSCLNKLSLCATTAPIHHHPHTLSPPPSTITASTIRPATTGTLPTNNLDLTHANLREICVRWTYPNKKDSITRLASLAMHVVSLISISIAPDFGVIYQP